MNNESSFQRDSVAELQQKAAWLSTGRLDTTETHGNVATRIIIEDKNGTWIVPLLGGIDVVNEEDAQWMKQSRAWVRAIEPGALNSRKESELIVSWLGTDDESRESAVNLEAATFIPREQQLGSIE